MAASSVMANCMATTALTPRATSDVATPANGSVSVARAPRHELRHGEAERALVAEQVDEDRA